MKGKYEEFYALKAAENKANSKPNKANSKPISSEPALASSLVSTDKCLRNEDFVYGLTVSAESAKMAQKLTLGNYKELGEKKLNSCDKAI